jgi:isoquinoline 1-oxidoreductase subunit beta
MKKQAQAATGTPKKRWRVTRRGFLIGAGALAGTVALGVTFGLPVARRRISGLLEDASAPGSASNKPDAWFEIQPDSRIRLYLTKVEMGQGVHTALTQLAAEDLDLRVSDFDVMQATTDRPDLDSFGTGGSNSVSSLYQPIRQAAATMREMLKAEAAKQLNQPLANLEIVERGVQAKGDAARRIAFADLRTTQKAWMANVPEQLPALKPRDQFKVIGQSVPRVDIPAKVTGEAIYGYDVRLEGMLYGAVLHKPTVGAKLLSCDGKAAEALDGVKKVVIKDGFAGVVATSRAAAKSGVSALNPTWDKGKLWQQAEIDALNTAGGSGGISLQLEGDPESIFRAGGVIEAEYRTPYAIQTPLEAQAGAADVKNGKATVYASTQSAGVVRREVAEALGFKPEDVLVHTTYLGGGFGRKSATEAVIEAAILSQAAGAPVHVGWDRESELRNGYLRPPTHHKLRAKLGANNKLDAMEHLQASGDVLFAFFPAIAGTVLGADFGATRGSHIRYAIPNRATTAWRKQLPVYSGPWRGLGALANAFAVDGFMDELAHAAKADPVQFRLDHIDDSPWGVRMRATIQAAAKAANWGGPVPAGRARGVACATDVNTTVCEIAEISMDAQNRITVHKFWAAIDPGLVVNPDGVKAQVEGNIMWGVGSTLIEEARIEDGRVSAANFDGYPLLTIKGAPQVETVLLESDGVVRGIGEPGIAPVAAAIGNALFALTGKRLRQIPFTPERIAAAA